MAHPTLLRRETFNGLINLNFDGIEAKYYRNKENETEYFISMAKEKGIIYTAGSDFHSLRERKSGFKTWNIRTNFFRRG